jgi:hypothetical protein
LLIKNDLIVHLSFGAVSAEQALVSPEIAFWAARRAITPRWPALPEQARKQAPAIAATREIVSMPAALVLRKNRITPFFGFYLFAFSAARLRGYAVGKTNT